LLSQIVHALTRNYCETKRHNAQSNNVLIEATRAPYRYVVFLNTFLNSLWTRCRHEGCTEVSKVFAALSLDPWHKGRRVDEENNPTTVRWIDMMRTYVDM